MDDLPRLNASKSIRLQPNPLLNHKLLNILSNFVKKEEIEIRGRKPWIEIQTSLVKADPRRAIPVFSQESRYTLFISSLPKFNI